MKKYLLFFIVYIFLSAFSIKFQNNIYAQGTYGCSFSPPTNCAVNSNCDTGYQSNAAACRPFTTESACNNAGPFPCIPLNTTITPEVQPPIGPDISKGCIDTAIGCIPIKDEQALAGFFLKWGMGIAAGVALVLISFSGYQIMTAAGDPRKLQAGKELLTAAVTGLVLLTLSAFILRFLGMDILGIF